MVDPLQALAAVLVVLAWAPSLLSQEPDPRRQDQRPRDGAARRRPWLVRHQERDGHWSAAGFVHRCPAGDPCGGPGHASRDVAVTGLAVLAFLHDGSTLRAGPYRDVVRRGIGWLRGRVDENGRFRSPNGEPDLYDQTIGTLALLEGYGLSGKPADLLPDVRRAVDHLQSPAVLKRLWRPSGADRTRAWAALAMRSAGDFRIAISKRARSRVRTWVEASPGASAPLRRAAVFLCRLLLDQRPEQQTPMRADAGVILAHPPVWKAGDPDFDLDYWFFGSYVMYQMGGKHWKAWRKRLSPAVVATQQDTGERRASWNPIGRRGKDGGRVHTTALAVLCLEFYYAYHRWR